MTEGMAQVVWQFLGLEFNLQYHQKGGRKAVCE
jgi:hypothetical protein